MPRTAVRVLAALSSAHAAALAGVRSEASKYVRPGETIRLSGRYCNNESCCQRHPSGACMHAQSAPRHR
jgi:hypothetical protein